MLDVDDGSGGAIIAAAYKRGFTREQAASLVALMAEKQPELEAWIAADVEWCARHPLVRRLMIESDGAPVTEAWQVLAERMVWRMRVSVQEGLGAQEKLAYAMLSLSSKPLLLSNRVADLLKKSPPLPRHKIAVRAPFPFMYISRETATVTTAETGEEALHNHVIAVVDSHEIDWIGDITIGAKVILSRAEIQQGATFPDDIEPDIRPGVEFVLKLMTFLSERLAIIQDRRMDRPDRRRLSKAGFDADAEETVGFIWLRALDKEEAAAAEKGEGRDW